MVPWWPFPKQQIEEEYIRPRRQETKVLANTGKGEKRERKWMERRLDGKRWN